MSAPAQFTANRLDAQKTTGSRTATCDYARNPLAHFRTILDIISAILSQFSPTNRTLQSLQLFMAMSIVFIKSSKKTNPIKKSNFGPKAHQNLQIALIFHIFLSRYSRCLGGKIRRISPKQTQFVTAFKLNSINHLTHVIEK